MILRDPWLRGCLGRAFGSGRKLGPNAPGGSLRQGMLRTPALAPKKDHVPNHPGGPLGQDACWTSASSPRRSSDPMILGIVWSGNVFDICLRSQKNPSPMLLGEQRNGVLNVTTPSQRAGKPTRKVTLNVANINLTQASENALCVRKASCGWADKTTARFALFLLPKNSRRFQK